MTDFHAHLLPAVDDGSESAAVSLRMLELWQEQKIDRICATPHFYAERTTPERFLRRRDSAYQKLLAAMEDQDEYPRILLGAEVRFFDGISATRELHDLCLAGTDLLLLEMPFVRWTDRMLGEVADICRRNIQPVIAHLERYIGFNNSRMISRLTGMDVFIQCNAEFFLTRRTTRKALSLLRDERIHFLGSDAHNTSDRPPNLGPALDLIGRKLGEPALERLRDLEELIDEGETPKA